jgi:hypothetical protein
MRLSEFIVPERVVKRVYEYLSLSNDERTLLLECLFEGIKGKNHEIEEFIASNKTEDPVIGNKYYPLGISFLIGIDKIEIIYSSIPLVLSKIYNDKFIYSNGESRVTFPLSLIHPSVVETTLHFNDIQEIQEFRNIIRLKYGDCKIEEYKV